jgi:hypothetical protein
MTDQKDIRKKIFDQFYTNTWLLSVVFSQTIEIYCRAGTPAEKIKELMNGELSGIKIKFKMRK